MSAARAHTRDTLSHWYRAVNTVVTGPHWRASGLQLCWEDEWVDIHPPSPPIRSFWQTISTSLLCPGSHRLCSSQLLINRRIMVFTRACITRKGPEYLLTWICGSTNSWNHYASLRACIRQLQNLIEAMEPHAYNFTAWGCYWPQLRVHYEIWHCLLSVELLQSICGRQVV